jgi:L-lactate dehydrogenase complex protein LldG
MTEASEAILKAIRDSLRTPVLPEAGHERPVRPSPPTGTPQARIDPIRLRDAFVAEVQALSGQAYTPAGQTQAIEILLNIVRASGAETALAWDEEYLPIPGVRGALTAAGVRILNATLPDEEQARGARLDELEGATVGVTGALAGLADTGSLALLSGPGRGRLASLLPPVHIAFLPLPRLYPTMAAFFTDHPGVALQGSNLVFISGPSRTADIEQVLTLGVHGPRELHVVLLADDR